MPPSSLIFAVIVAVWAAYVIQHWVHRREHVATARSVDRFSEAMRVLERRQRRPHVDLSEPTPRSYSVSLMRPAAPDVVIKRAHPSSPRPVVTPPSAPTRHTGATRLPDATHRRMSVSRMRGVGLVSAVAIFLVSLIAAATGLLTWWAVLIAAGVVAVAVVMVRRSVSRASVRRAASVRSVRPVRAAPIPAGRRSRRSMASAGGSAAAAFASNLHDEQLTSLPLAKAAQPPVVVPAAPTAAPAAVIDAPTSVSAAIAGSTGVYDIDAIERGMAAVPDSGVNVPPVVAEPLEPGTWAPVPVPPPTYTLKAKARPRPVRAELPTELPQDGFALSLEEEFEELPAAIRG